MGWWWSLVKHSKRPEKNFGRRSHLKEGVLDSGAHWALKEWRSDSEGELIIARLFHQPITTRPYPNRCVTEARLA